jgi:hypothetical protein
MREYDWIRIENLSQFLFTEIPKINPISPRYIKWWREAKRVCIEGMWGQEFGKYRYCPGRIPWYGSFCSIAGTDEIEKTRRTYRPSVSDLEWERAYMMLEAEGFSGWYDDDMFTSDMLVFEYSKNHMPESNIDMTRIIRKDGKFKEYIAPRDNIRMLHDRPMGLPRYRNNAKNILELGSRGGGKSYWYSLAGVLYSLVFLGIKYYTDENRLNPPDEVGTLVGSGDSGKSSEFIDKVVKAMNELATNQDLGVWGSLDSSDYTPSPFYKHMSGVTSSNNKENHWRHEVEERTINGFVTKEYCYLNHVSYSNNRQGSAEKGAGGRYNIAITEEIGLTELLIESWTSNEATVSTDGNQFGVQAGLGTAGNIKLIQPAKRMFTNPKSYKVVEYDDVWEASGKIGFFLPAYMTLRQFKDVNGNTDIERAKQFIQKRREEAEQSADNTVIRVEKMNYPIKPSEMWVTDKSYILPYEEAAAREKELMKGNSYKKIGTAVKLFWSAHANNGVDYELDTDNEPYWDFPFKEMTNGTTVIYQHPVSDIPEGLYNIIGHDPYIAEEQKAGGSVGCTYIVVNPKYIPEGYHGSTIVATLIGKPEKGLEAYYEAQEKLIAYYGNPTRSLWYEADRGDYCRGYYIKKNKAHLLCLRPQYEKGSSARHAMIMNYGYLVGNRVGKLHLLQLLRDWLMTPTTIDGITLLNIQRIPCIFLIRQIMQFDIDKGNYDAVMTMCGVALGIKEQEHLMTQLMTKKGNKLGALSMMYKQGQQQNREHGRQQHK